MNYRQRKQAAINDYILGIDKEEIMDKYSFSELTLKLILKDKNAQLIDPNIFNVDEYECWISPALHESILRKPKKNNDANK